MTMVEFSEAHGHGHAHLAWSHSDDSLFLAIPACHACPTHDCGLSEVPLCKILNTSLLISCIFNGLQRDGHFIRISVLQRADLLEPLLFVLGQ